MVSCSDTDIVSNNSMGDSRIYQEKSIDFQLEAIEAHNRIDNTICVTTREGKAIYPSYFGGSYIDKSGKLIVLICGNFDEGKKQIKAVDSNSGVEYRRVEFSYQELRDLMDILNKRIVVDSCGEIRENLIGYALMVEKNLVEVSLIDCSEKSISKFKKLMTDSPMLMFKSGKPLEEQATEISPGGRASLSATSERFGSYAFRAQEINGLKRRGMVTAGHVAAINTPIYFSGKIIGTCIKSQNSGSIDAGFILINDTVSYPLTNYITGMVGCELSAKTSSPGVGTLVNLRGAKSGSTSGYIVSTDATYKIPSTNMILTNLTTATYSSQDGDSGGIVYTYISSNDIRYTVGVHKGTDQGTGVFSKADLVLSALGLKRY